MQKDQALALHQEALSLAQQSRDVDTKLIDVITQIKKGQAYLFVGYSNLRQYCMEALGLSYWQSQTYLSIAEKSELVPALKEKVEAGEIHLTNARLIAPTLTVANSAVWLKKATELPQRKLEKELATAFPEREGKERIRALNAERSELKLGISHAFESKLERVKDVLSQKLKKSVQTEEALFRLMEEFLEKHDPLLKAQRNAPALRPKPVLATKNGKRTATPAAMVHLVAQRDSGRCVEILPNGKRCDQTRFVHKHHPDPVANGGRHSVDNFETLCWGHHKAKHLNETGSVLLRDKRWVAICSPSSPWAADKRLGPN
jgi:5-methylcytosine-specific restriction endonuclease McrA